MKVYLVKLDADIRFEDEDLGVFPAKRRENIKHLRFYEDKKASFICGMLIRYCAAKEKSIMSASAELAYGKYGKPYHPDYPQYHFSVSHTRYCVVYVKADVPVGIDTERHTLLDETSYSVARDFFTADEYSTIISSSNQTLEFFRIWTAKEAFLKCTGEGLTRSLDSFSVLSLPEGYECSSMVYGDDHISVCCKGGCDEIIVKEITAQDLLTFEK